MHDRQQGPDTHGSIGTTSLVLPESVEVVKLDLCRPRIITLVGVKKRGEIREYHLKVTPKGGLALL